MAYVNDVLGDSAYSGYLDCGFVGLIDVMGSDADICRSARVSYGRNEGEIDEKKDRGLIRYLMRNHHTSPFEMAEVKFHLKMPIFVMRQHVRHRTANINEYSGRYSEMTHECFVPPIDRFQTQDTHNKQGSAETLPNDMAQDFRNAFMETAQQSYSFYNTMLNENVSKEIARTILPVGMYTELYWKIDLHNFLHYAKLRMDSHAQPEIQMLARIMYEKVKEHFPMVCEAFEDYVLHSVLFSDKELEVLSLLIDDAFFEPGAIEVFFEECDFGFAKTELKDLIRKLRIIVNKK